MKSLYLIPTLGLLVHLHANEALEILEGRKDAADAVVTVVPDDAALIQGGTASADGKVTKPFIPSEPSAFSKKSHEILDPIWSKTTIIKEEENPYIQELTMIGLFEATGAWGQVETTTATATAPTATQRNLDDIAMRRAQLGARMKAFYRTEVTGVVEMAGNSRMNGIQTLKARTEIYENTGITIGKFRPLSTQENGMPDGELLTNERSLMSNMIAPADSLGVMFDAKNKDWSYNLGWFSGDYSNMIPNVKDNGLINAGMAYETTGKTETGVTLHSPAATKMPGVSLLRRVIGSCRTPFNWSVATTTPTPIKSTLSVAATALPPIRFSLETKASSMAMSITRSTSAPMFISTKIA